MLRTGVIEFLKFVGTAMTAAAAIYAVFTDRLKAVDKKHHLTRKGWGLLGILITGIIISAGLQILQLVDTLDSASHMADRFDRLAEPIDLSMVTIDGDLTWSIDDASLSTWRGRLLGAYKTA